VRLRYQIIIETDKQLLWVWQAGNCVATYSISTARNGLGELKNSQQTPRGWHRIRAKVGAGAAENAVFIGRRQTGEIYTPDLGREYPERDWILTRIIWLSGLEKGKNRLGICDTMRRYIYIHGTLASEPMGEPKSHGCIRMRNQDIIDLFEYIEVGDRVYIL
jgi:lipoprotein-anchoring transpeptidase ErfK/SrfK